MQNIFYSYTYRIIITVPYRSIKEHMERKDSALHKLSLLLGNSTRTCKWRHPFACFDKWTASTVIPLPDLLQPPWFHSINFQSQRSLCSAAATVIAAPSLAGYSYLHIYSFFYFPPYPFSHSWFTCLSSRKSFATQVYFPIFIELPVKFERVELNWIYYLFQVLEEIFN